MKLLSFEVAIGGLEVGAEYKIKSAAESRIIRHILAFVLCSLLRTFL